MQAERHTELQGANGSGDADRWAWDPAAPISPITFGTMGPLTCADLALDELLSRGQVPASKKLYPTFDEARAALLRREIDVVLVPHCHPVSTEMLFDPQFHFEMGAAFDKPNPALYLASRPDESRSLSKLDLCAALPIVWPLVAAAADTGNLGLRLLPVPSNPAAAQAVREGRADLAITNAPSLEALGLRPVKVLKHVHLRWFPVRLASEARSARPAATLQQDHAA